MQIQKNTLNQPIFGGKGPFIRRKANSIQESTSWRLEPRILKRVSHHGSNRHDVEGGKIHKNTLNQLKFCGKWPFIRRKVTQSKSPHHDDLSHESWSMFHIMAPIAMMWKRSAARFKLKLCSLIATHRTTITDQSKAQCFDWSVVVIN